MKSTKEGKGKEGQVLHTSQFLACLLCLPELLCHHTVVFAFHTVIMNKAFLLSKVNPSTYVLDPYPSPYIINLP